MSVIPFSSVDEVVAMSNDNEYGLAAAVWINDSQPAPTEMPWGGYKQSGIGRELGKHGVDDFLESKSVYLNLADEAPRRGRTVAPDLGYAPRSWPVERSSSSIW